MAALKKALAPGCQEILRWGSGYGPKWDREYWLEALELIGLDAFQQGLRACGAAGLHRFLRAAYVLKRSQQPGRVP